MITKELKKIIKEKSSKEFLGFLEKCELEAKNLDKAMKKCLKMPTSEAMEYLNEIINHKK